MMNGLDEAKFMLMIDRPRVRKSLIAEEGDWYNGQRDDPGGGRTIGVGHHMDTKVTQEGYRLAMNQPNYNGGEALLPPDLKWISNPAVNRILNDDIFRSVIEAREFLISPSLWVSLGEVRREVVVQMAFQMGLRKLSQFTQFRQALVDRDYDKAAFEMLHSADGKRPSKWATQTPERARRMADAMQDNNPANFQQGHDPYDAG